MKKLSYSALFVAVICILVIITQSFVFEPVQSSNNGENTPIKRPKLVLAGIDSLTNGPIYQKTKSRYLDDFIPRMHDVFGDGGPGYVPFDSIYFKQEHGTFRFSYGVHEINDLVPGKYPSQYSLDLKGIYTKGGYLRWMRVDMPRSMDWKYGEIFYLQQPNGGSFRVGYTQSGQREEVHTKGSLKLGVVTLPKNKYDGRLTFSHINGKVVIFGGLFLNDHGVAVSRIGQGGDRLDWHARIHNNMMAQWLKELNPSLFIFNGGMNDRSTLSAKGYKYDLNNYLQPFIKENCRLLLVAPNAILGNNRILKEYENVLVNYAKNHGTGFISNKEALGENYLKAESKGYMGDRIHPNDLGSKVISQHLFNYLIHEDKFSSLFHTDELPNNKG
ncbi:SGNH/GDSL hydrolase family protein [Scopulibacillus darangshiensis]|nr:hypothetical protein [Scopulibacillus darangshiensis]